MLLITAPCHDIVYKQLKESNRNLNLENVHPKSTSLRGFDVTHFDTGTKPNLRCDILGNKPQMSDQYRKDNRKQNKIDKNQTYKEARY